MIKSSHFLIMWVLSFGSYFYYSNLIIDELAEKIFDLQEQNQELHDELYILEFDVTVTMYNPTRGQTDTTPNELADGTKINPYKANEYRYVALSRDLLSRWDGPFDYGDYIVIEGTEIYDGVYQVKDTMNSRFTKRVDILRTRGTGIFKYTNIKLYKYRYDHNEYSVMFADIDEKL